MRDPWRKVAENLWKERWDKLSPKGKTIVLSVLGIPQSLHSIFIKED